MSISSDFLLVVFIPFTCTVFASAWSCCHLDSVSVTMDYRTCLRSLLEAAEMSEWRSVRCDVILSLRRSVDVKLGTQVRQTVTRRGCRAGQHVNSDHESKPLRPGKSLSSLRVSVSSLTTRRPVLQRESTGLQCTPDCATPTADR